VQSERFASHIESGIDRHFEFNRLKVLTFGGRVFGQATRICALSDGWMDGWMRVLASVLKGAVAGAASPSRVASKDHIFGGRFTPIRRTAPPIQRR
jgi:hypothetical protein